MKGVVRFVICWVVAVALWQTLMVHWQHGAAGFVFGLFDPGLAVAALVAALLWSWAAKSAARDVPTKADTIESEAE